MLDFQELQKGTKLFVRVKRRDTSFLIPTVVKMITLKGRVRVDYNDMLFDAEKQYDYDSQYT